MEDWAVWPIFLVQGIICFLLLVPKNKSLLGFSLELMIKSMLTIVCVAIVASVYHDSTTPLKLFF